MDWEELPNPMPPALGMHQGANWNNPTVYGFRVKHLPLAGRDFEQIRIKTAGGMAWVNCPHDEVTPLPQPNKRGR